MTKTGIDMPRTHGMTKTPTYRAWADMLHRCNNPNAQNFARYGGRGITVCAHWQSFENFLADMGERPDPSLSLERKNNQLGYSKQNCRWATRSAQQRNTRMRRDNKAGAKGIFWDNARSRWVAVIGRKWLGAFGTPTDAAKARKAAERWYWGAR